MGDINRFSWQMLPHCSLWDLLELWAASCHDTGDHELVLISAGTLENKQKVFTWKDPGKHQWESAGISPAVHPESNGVLQSCRETEMRVPWQCPRATLWGHTCSTGLQPFSGTLPLGMKLGITEESDTGQGTFVQPAMWLGLASVIKHHDILKNPHLKWHGCLIERMEWLKLSCAGGAP